jgi:hypothetical protein
MGTRADFYTITGKNLMDPMEWCGSIAWDGNPKGIDENILLATTKEEFKKAIKDTLSKREDFTSPALGWPWPWEDSNTTDYAYVFINTRVLTSNFGSNYFEANTSKKTKTKPNFPNMKNTQNIQFGGKSGLMIFRL